jgi:hypothetical protein
MESASRHAETLVRARRWSAEAFAVLCAILSCHA